MTDEPRPRRSFLTVPGSSERFLLDAYSHATANDHRGAVMLDGEMIDEASRKLALVAAARGRVAGLRRTTQ